MSPLKVQKGKEMQEHYCDSKQTVDVLVCIRHLMTWNNSSLFPFVRRVIQAGC